MKRDRHRGVNGSNWKTVSVSDINTMSSHALPRYKDNNPSELSLCILQPFSVDLVDTWNSVELHQHGAGFCNRQEP
jgi:hypothetical protein